MNNGDIAEKLALENGLTKADARKLVDAVFTVIAEAAVDGDEISLSAFGKFKVKATAEREGRDLPPDSPSVITRVLRLNTTAPAPAQARRA